MLEKLEECLIPVRAAFAAAAGISDEKVQFLTDHLLFTMPSLCADTGIILGATRATAFVVDKAVQAGHTNFVVIGGKPVGQEDRHFTRYILEGLEAGGLPLPPDSRMPEKDYARFLLTDHFRVPAENILSFEDDHSRQSNANMQVLKAHGFEHRKALEFYTLSGAARRVLMTARKVLGHEPVMAAHNAFPSGMNARNWFTQAAGRAYLTAEGAKILTDDPSRKKEKALYVRLGYCANINLNREIERGIQHKPF